MKRFVITIVVILFGLFIKAQVSQDYIPVISEGEFPEIYSDYLKLKNRNNNSSKNYHIQLIKTGRIIYGTILNKYIDKIVDELLKNDPKMRSQIQCYVLNSTEVNAFSTKEGILYVNLGLLAQISNEAELAFILGHEISHFACKHIAKQDKFQKQNRKENKKKIFQYLDYRNYSRENELEADKLSFEKYYNQSVYNPQLIDGTFDVLQYRYLPFDEKKFSKTLFETRYYTFPDNYSLNALNPIRSREDYIDTLSSHPNLLKRRTMIKNLTITAPVDGKIAFMQEEALFEEVRKIARLECISVYLTEHDYINAYYNSFVLKELYPDMPFLDIAMVTSIYGIAKHKSDGSLGDVINDYKDKEGEIQQTYYFFSKLSKQELSVLALRELWKIHIKYPTNDFVKKLCKDVAKDVVGLYKLDYTKFSDYPADIAHEDINLSQTIENKIDTIFPTKYQKIKNKSLQKVLPDSKFKTVNYMLADLRKEKSFLDFLWEIEENIADEKTLNSIQRATKEVIRADELIFSGVDYNTSFYSNISNEKASSLLLKKQNAYNKIVAKTTKKLKFDIFNIQEQIHSVEYDTRLYNQMSKIVSINKEYEYSKSTNAILYQCYDLSAIQSGLQNKNILSLSVYSMGYHYTVSFWLLPLIIVCPYALALPIISLSIPENDTRCLFSVLSLGEGKTVFSDRYFISKQSGQAFLSAYIYDMLYKMKKGVKK